MTRVNTRIPEIRIIKNQGDEIFINVTSEFLCSKYLSLLLGSEKLRNWLMVSNLCKLYIEEKNFTCNCLIRGCFPKFVDTAYGNREV